jgi:DNA helicase-2/ATP-dependent DNA helicase PcrA
MFDELSGLNPAQQKAVTITEGPVLVLAGAGSGKTRVITHRICHLIKKGVAPQHILAVTFTNKAAREMRDRVFSIINSLHRPLTPDGGQPTLSTFHSLGVMILREHHAALGLRRHFVISDRSDSLRAIKKAMEIVGLDPKEHEPRTFLSIISRAKGDAVTRLEFADRAQSYTQEMAARVWEHYDNALHADHALDFDDLLAKTLHLLRNHPTIREEYQRRFIYIHIDEYQDTNRVQFEIARLLAGERAHLCVVGDVDQSIYSWRGADIKNILQFERHYPGAVVIFLEENYRSTETIIQASNDIIEKNINRPPKTVFTNNPKGDPISLYVAMTGRDEAEHVVMTIKNLLTQGATPSDIAVLYRTNFQSRSLEEACLDYGIPYQLLGTRFFERTEIKDMLSYLRFALNPDSQSDLGRIVNTPTRGIGKVTLLKLLEGKRDSLTGATAAKVDSFYALIDRIRNKAETSPLPETLKYILNESGLEQSFRQGGEEGEERLENVRELVTLSLKYTDRETPQAAIEALLEDAALGSDQDELKDKQEQDAVRLMTVHAAKGLEFPYVFITGLEEGLFPHERLGDEKTDTEEERRLFYVALTRAEKKVFLSFAHLRTIFGSERVNLPSSFISDIRSDLIEGENPAESGFERTIYLD